MAQLVLLVVAAAWAAVLIPPMLRSRVENHPNSSVTDFRRQLNTLQSSSTPARGSLRAMGRPLTQSPLQRPAAAGRPGQHLHRQAAVHVGMPAAAPQPAPVERQRCGRTATRRAGRTARTARPTWPARPIRAATSSAGAATSCSCSSSSRRAACSSPPPRGRPRCCTCSRWRSSPLRLRVPAGATPPARAGRRRVAAPVQGAVPTAVREPVVWSANPVVRALLSAARLFSSHGAIAQLVERDNRTVEAKGSIPFSSTIIR